MFRVDQAAAALDVPVRRLQRLFAEYVGAGPKWVLRRARLHEAAARADQGSGLDWVSLAAELGYADQAHMTRDFTAAVGVPPARYAGA
jgi:transcriptional regulator GlxA family with amidase domain